MQKAPWDAGGWLEAATANATAALLLAGRPPTGEWTNVRTWARSCVRTVPTAAGILWIKHSYRLPPGEEVVVAELSRRWPAVLPTIVATWPGGFAMEAIPGEELTAGHALKDWVVVARTIAEIAAGETVHAEEWLERGVRDRRPAEWPGQIAGLLGSPVLDTLDVEVRNAFEEFVDDFTTRYLDAFELPPTLVHQDSGCCNIQVRSGRVVIFDWADVIVGHPMFSCDRLLDQAPQSFHAAVIDAFCAPLTLSIEEFRAMRRSNVLHEILRYHDELAYIAPADPAAESLANSVRSQIQVLVEHERKRR